MFDWSTSGFSQVLATARFDPLPGSRGAYGVVGLLLVDLMTQFPGDELVVATISVVGRLLFPLPLPSLRPLVPPTSSFL